MKFRKVSLIPLAISILCAFGYAKEKNAQRHFADKKVSSYIQADTTPDKKKQRPVQVTPATVNPGTTTNPVNPANPTAPATTPNVTSPTITPAPGTTSPVAPAPGSTSPTPVPNNPTTPPAVTPAPPTTSPAVPATSPTTPPRNF